MAILRRGMGAHGRETAAATSSGANGKAFERSGAPVTCALKGLNRERASAALKPLAYGLWHALRGFAWHLPFPCTTEFVIINES